MYRYDEFDAEFVRQRVAQFRDQVGRRQSGGLTEDEFKPLRLMNGVYLQLHAYMLRIAIPYGTLSSRQMRKLALCRAWIFPARNSTFCPSLCKCRKIRSTPRSWATRSMP